MDLDLEDVYIDGHGVTLDTVCVMCVTVKSHLTRSYIHPLNTVTD